MPYLLEALEVIVEVAQNNLVVECLRHVLTFENLRADVYVLRFQTHLSFLDSLLGFAFEVVKSLFAVTCIAPCPRACGWRRIHSSSRR